MKITKKSRFLIFLTLFAIVIGSYLIQNYFFKKEKEVWLNIFVHGSFHSVLGLLDTYKVVNDEVQGTSYKKIVSKMRKEDFFFKGQPILRRGLVKVQPSFDLESSGQRCYAAYPILKAYDLVSKAIQDKNSNIENIYYTFGWSGLISQKRRRFESIRFYNYLSEEIEKYNKQKIFPKIRILTHSHGGNLALNLGAIKEIISNNFSKLDLSTDQKKALNNMYQTLENLDDYDQAKQKLGQKAYDYYPVNKDLYINELIMYGTPIQPETEHFAFSDNTFEKVYNFYSAQDIVQKIDWVSSRRLYSDQRLNSEVKETNVIQAKIMIGKKSSDKVLFASNNKENFWSKLFSSDSENKNLDPTHKQLWFICWENIDKEKENLFSFIPVAIFTPLLTKTIDNLPEKLNDIDLNLKLTSKKLSVSVFNHDQKEIQNKYFISRDLVENIKNNIIRWKPQDTSHNREIELIKTYTCNIFNKNS